MDVDVFTTFFYSANLRLKGKENLNNLKPVVFLTPDNTELNVMHPLSKAALLYLQEVHPYTPNFDELYAHAAARVAQAGGKAFAVARGELVNELFSLYSYRAVYGHLYACLHRPEWPEYPQATALARLQAAQGWESVASIRHQALSLDSFSRRLLQELDGSRTVPALVSYLTAEVNAGNLPIPGGKQTQTSGKGLEKEISDNVKHLLTVFARHGLVH